MMNSFLRAPSYLFFPFPFFFFFFFFLTLDG